MSCTKIKAFLYEFKLTYLSLLLRFLIYSSKNLSLKGIESVNTKVPEVILIVNWVSISWLLLQFHEIKGLEQKKLPLIIFFNHVSGKEQKNSGIMNIENNDQLKRTLLFKVKFKEECSFYNFIQCLFFLYVQNLEFYVKPF